MSEQVLANVTCVAVAGRGLLLEGPPGIGKSTLALALIDRGAVLVGDDGVTLRHRHGRLWALPPPNIAGRLEVRGVGLISLETTTAPVALILLLGGGISERLPEPGTRALGEAVLPFLRFDPSVPEAALRAEWALRLHGLTSEPPTA